MAAPGVRTGDPDGVIDWTRGMITAQGAAAGDLRAPSPAIARVAAERRAKRAAGARLTRMVGRLSTAGGVVVGTGSGAAKARLERAAAAARVLSIEYGSDGSVLASLGLPIEAVRVALFGVAAAPSATKGAPTALLVDARGIVSAPALGIELMAGGERYAAPTVFHRRLATASADPRVGAVPLQVRAVRYKDGRVVLGARFAARLAAARNAGALVVLVVGADKEKPR